MISPNFKLFLIALALLLGVSLCASADIAEPFDTLDAAVVEALDAADALAPSYEAGGSIYKCGQTFVVYPPTTEMKTYSVSIPVYKAEGCTLVAFYHTHPLGDSHLSPVDIGSACRFKIVSYIRPKGGKIASYDCSNKSGGAIQAARLGR